MSHMRQHRYKHLLPMLMSMILLAVFLVVYLYKNYKTSSQDLQGQTQLYLENAFKTAESQMFDKMLIELRGVSIFDRHSPGQNDVKIEKRNISFAKVDTTKTAVMKAITLSSKAITDILDTKSNPLNRDSTKKLQIRMSDRDSMNFDTLLLTNHVANNFTRKISFIRVDSISGKNADNMVWIDDPQPATQKPKQVSVANRSNVKVKISIKNDSLGIDSTISGQQITDIKLVKNLFQENIKKAGIHINHFITEDSLSRGNSKNPEYCELITGKKYFLNIDNNQRYLLIKLAPDFVISLLLFIAVGFAFYHLISSYNKNQELSDLKDDFLRNMTHELKTPLATMGVAIEALQNFKADGDKQLREEYLRIAENENFKLSNLVDKVLTITNHLDNQTQPYENTHLPNLTEEVLHSFKLRLDQKSTQYRLENRLTDSYYQLNQQVLTMIQHNLIDNAIKYNHAPEPLINIKLDENNTHLFISVNDNGTLIDATHQQKIFEKFYRIPHGNVHDVKGHGLGLYIVQQLVNSIKGTIQLETTEKGNHFIIQLPKVKTHS